MKPHRNKSSLTPNRGLSRETRGGLTVAALVLIPLLAVAAGDAFRAALDFGAGVLSLVSLTAAVAWGLMATDRLVLSPRHRLLAQAVHRATAVASLGFLLLHITVKVSLGHVALIGAVVPFGLGVSGTNGLIGLGSLAGFLMVVAATTGVLRSAFAVPGRIPGRWRALHMVAYPAWCFALMHGLYAGRPAAAWVTTMYCLSLCAVAAAVSARLLPRPLQRRITDRIMPGAGPVRAAPGPEPSRRDPLTGPLPGTVGLATGQAGYDRRFPRDPAGQPESAGFQRPPPARLTAPSPPLYEVSRPAADPLPATGSFARPDAAPGAGAGLSAGYRSVSGWIGTAPAPGQQPPFVEPAFGTASASGNGGPSGGIPLAERIPMTEELPVIAESQDRPGTWPTPSPPSPGQALAPAAPSPYDTGAVPAVDTPYDTGAVPVHGPHTASPYGTGATPVAGTGANPLYGTDARPAYSTGVVPPYPAGSPPPYGAADDGGSRPPFDGYSPASSAPPTGDGLMPSSGPLGAFHPPQAGEPWHAPAGDRP